ncbi:ATP-dependent nuclease [Leuconostoc suionicum]|uniref:ATP-dependent nuclease n=1 Tax=Leuconostoc suionicum TaxID=1511761 RepID=UPI002953C844|nr:AAA family ATPase [Leuconostoc suionicum]MDV7703575.1 AAA family ATPase [Leuconostoc suionicum]
MNFKYISIKNFRSFKDIQISISNKSVFFGLNDVGKTNLLTALRFVFDRNMRKKDFIDSDYFKKNVSDPIEIVVCINIDDQNDDSAKIRPYIKGAIKSGQKEIYIKLVAKYDDSELIGSAEMWWGGNLEELEEIKSSGNRFDIDNIFNVFYIDSYVDMDKLFKQNIKKLIKSDITNEDDKKTHERIDSIVSDLNDQIASLSGVSDFESKITPVYQRFNNKEMSISVKSEIAVKGLYSNIVPYMKRVNDDNIYPTAGEGRKKLVVYSLYSLLAEAEASKKINIFLIEEPENNLHKSMQIELSEILFSSTDNYPFLFVSTHSPYILYEMDDITLVRVYAHQDIISSSVFYEVPLDYQRNKKMLNRSLSEALFANSVLLVEGPSEQLLFDKVLSYICPYYESKGMYILAVNGIAFKNYHVILKKLGINTVIKTDNDIQRRNNGFYALGFSRINKLTNNNLRLEWFTNGNKGEDKKDFYKHSIFYRRLIYNNSQEPVIKTTLEKIRKEDHIYISKVDLENDLDDVLHDRLTAILEQTDPVKYLQGAKNIRMVELIEKLQNVDCIRIYNHENFACLMELTK